MRYLVLAAVLLAACADALAGPPLPDITGTWLFHSLATSKRGSCQIVGNLNVTQQSATAFQASFTGIRGCEGPYPSYATTIAGTISGDSLFFNFDALTTQRGAAGGGRMNGTLRWTISDTLYTGGWNAERCGSSCPVF